MAIRFKNTTICARWTITKYGGEECALWGNEETPIEEWDIPFFSIKTDYTKEGTLPSGRSVTIGFPELWLWKERQSDEVVFGFETVYSSAISDWLEVISPNAKNNMFPDVNPSEVALFINFKNLITLTEGTHNASIRLKAFWKKNDGNVFIEYAPQTIDITLRVLSNPNTPPRKFHDAGTINITYNKTTGVLSGELDLQYPVGNNRLINQPGFIDLEKTQNGYSIVKNETTTKLQNGLHPGIVAIASAAGEWRYSIKLIVTEDSNRDDFFITPQSFRLSLDKNSNSTQSGKVQITNPKNLNIEVAVKPTFIAQALIENNQMIFQTVSSSTLGTGDHSGDIILKSGNIMHPVRIALKVIQALKSDFQGQSYYFALDKHKIVVSKTHPDISYIKLSMEMVYRGFGKIFRERQDYIYPYFHDKIDLFPGDEVQDFFIRISQLNSIEPTEYQYHFAVVNITVYQYDNDDKEQSRSELPPLFFAPGKKPKCFPIFTDFPVRRTFNNSKIRLSTDILSLHLQEIPNIHFPASIPKMEVHAFTFERKNAGDEKEIINAGTVQFIPFPEAPSGRIVHIFFENQNLVLDWFSCSGHYHWNYRFSHILNEYTAEKSSTLETQILTINTGWILKEEILLINALIKSRICFIILDGEIIKARPISVKNEMQHSDETLFSMDLEFNIKQNER